MHAYPGRTIGQLYHRFFRVNELADGHAASSATTQIDLADVRVPVLSIAGTTDVLAPRAAVHHVAELLPNAPEVRARDRARAATSACSPAARRSAPPGAWLDEFFAAAGRRATPLRVVA